MKSWKTTLAGIAAIIAAIALAIAHQFDTDANTVADWGAVAAAVAAAPPRRRGALRLELPGGRRGLGDEDQLALGVSLFLLFFGL